MLDYLRDLQEMRQTLNVKEKLLAEGIKSTGNLHLIIKTYKSRGSFSALLEKGSEKKFKIEGPFVFELIQGNGLGITIDCNWRIIIIAAGTGILPFLDFFDYLLKKSIFTVLDKGFKNSGSDINFFGEDYKNSFRNEFSLELYCAFNEESDFLGKDIILPLYKISKDYSLNFFDMKIRYSKSIEIDYPTMNQRFNHTFCHSCVKQKEEIDKIFVCGPPKMNREIPNYFNKLGFSSEKIILV